MLYLKAAQDDFERSEGDVTENYAQYLQKKATLEALLAIAQQLESLEDVIANRSDQISTDLQNIEYTLNLIRMNLPTGYSASGKID